MMNSEQTPSTVLIPMEGFCSRCGAELSGFGSEKLCAVCMFDSAIADEASTIDGLPPSASQRFGNYEIIGEIARGGMGVVFKARQACLNRIVAVKMMLGGQLASEAERARFRAEAETAARLQHPHIVAIHEVGECDGQPFFSMDFVDGQNLAQLVGNTPLPAARAAKYLQVIAEAVHFAHQRGVLHRDLKPSNVLVDANDQPRVTDFGLAKVMDGDTSLTLTGQVLGSPSFMPPEQSGGEHKAVGAASDVYSLGAMLYFLLTARAPFVADSVPATLRLVTEAEPVSPRLLNTVIPRDLETICLKCLEKDPARRYPTAQEFAKELGRFLLDEPILARPTTQSEKLWRWCRRNRALATAGGTALTLLLVVAVGSPIAALRIDRARKDAEEREAIVRDNGYASDIVATAQALDDGNFGLARNLIESHRPRAGQKDRRGFEWRYLWAQSKGQQRATLSGHSGPVLSVAYSPDGTILASGGADHTIRLWNPKTGELIDTLSGHTGEVLRITFSTDGRMLASSGADDQVRLWEVSSRRVITTLPYRKATVSLAGDLLAIGTDHNGFAESNGTATVWNWVEQREVLKLSRAGNLAVLSPNGQTLATANGDSKLRVWDVMSGRELKSFESRRTTALVFVPDGRALAWARKDGGEIRIWKLGEEKARLLSDHNNITVTALAFSPDGRHLVSSEGDHSLGLWDVERGIKEETLRGHGEQPLAVAFSPNGGNFASGGRDGKVMIWDRNSDSASNVIPDVEVNTWLRMRDPVFSPDSKLVAVAPTGTGGVQLWDVTTCQLVGKLEIAAYPIAFSADGQRLLILHEPTVTIQWWDIARNAVLETVRLEFTPAGGLNADAIAPDLNSIAIARHQEITLLSARTGRKLFSFSLAPLRSIEFSPDSLFLAVGHFDGAISLWEMRTGQSAWTARGLKGVVSSMAFSQDGKQLAAGTWDNFIHLLDAATGRPLTTLSGHKNGVDRVVFSRDGRTLASVSGDPRIKLWNLATGREVLTFPKYVRAMPYLGFSPDGNTFAAAGGAYGVSGIQLWRVPSQLEIDTPSTAAPLSKRPTDGQTEGTPVLPLQTQANPARLDPEMLARTGKFKEAVPQFVSHIAAEKKNTMLVIQYAAVLAEIGDTDAYTRLCSEQLNRYSKTDNAGLLRRISKTCLLTPLPERQTELACALAMKAMRVTTDTNSMFWAELGVGLAAYRSGNFAESIEVMAKVAPSPDFASPQAGVTATVSAVQAMAYHRLGQSEQARVALDQTEKLLEAAWFTENRTDLGGHWHDVVIAHALLREARGLIRAQ